MYEEYFDYDQNLIQVTEYQVLGQLPSPFVFDNGAPVKTKEDWALRRKEIYRTAVELQYGTQPPKPEVFRVEPTYVSDDGGSYRIIAGTKEKQVSFMMKIIRPVKVKTPTPVAVDGDFCFNYSHNSEYVNLFTDNGISLVLFNRTELACDEPIKERRGPLYEVYPDYTFGAIGAWAWGYSRCVDALEQIDGYDMSCVAFTGHSRGGKTAMLAGALDERAVIVNPNETNQGACSCYRINMKAITEKGNEFRNETLKDLCTRYGFWVGEGMQEYVGREQDLPFDAHLLKAMIAPRILLIGEAASDIWTNPIGSWQTSLAATKVFEFLGCKQNLLWYFRKGFHRHLPADISMLVEVIRHYREGAPLSDRYYKTPFKPTEPIFDFDIPNC